MRTALFTLLLPLALVQLPHDAAAQTYFYVDAITVEPASPTTVDEVTISVSGDLSSTGSSITSTSYELVGNEVQITLTATSGPGADVLVPHTEAIAIGTLAAGTYSIVLNGAYILDSAPAVEHTFEVLGAGQDCDGLTIASVQWSTLSDTLITVHVYSTEILFSYPGFVLLNNNGDTLAKEVVDLFALGTESWNLMRVRPGAEIPQGPFTGTLQLWTGFYAEMACSWDMTVDLCPATECVTAQPSLSNFGGALVTGAFDWVINGVGGTLANGTFELDGSSQTDNAEVCLTPGSYELVITPLQGPLGGQLVMGVGGQEWNLTVQQPLPQGIPSAPLPFTVLAACVDGTNSTEALEGETDILRVRHVSGGIALSTTDDSPLGSVLIHDAVGRTIHASNNPASNMIMRIPANGIFLVHARGHCLKVGAGVY